MNYGSLGGKRNYSSLTVLVLVLLKAVGYLYLDLALLMALVLPREDFVMLLRCPS